MAAVSTSQTRLEPTEHGGPIVLVVTPPSRPTTPRGMGYGQPICSGTFQNLSPTLTASHPLQGSVSSQHSTALASDDETAVDSAMNSAATSVTDVSISSDTDGVLPPNTTVYHIYHTGRADASFSIRTVKDSSLVELSSEPKRQPVILDGGCPPALCIGGSRNRSKSSLSYQETTVDDLETDPGRATYFMHTPLLYWHLPARTLRFGHNKKAPVVCLVEGSWFWRSWRLDFVVPEEKGESKDGGVGEKDRVDSGFAECESGGGSAGRHRNQWKGLNEPGVIDPRGVLASKYPLRPTGHWRGETGKWYQTECARRRKCLAAKTSNPPPKEAKSFSETARNIFRVNSASQNPPKGSIAHPQLALERGVGWIFPHCSPPPKLPEHLKLASLEDASLVMKWSGRNIREYDFNWRGVGFVWKGTSTVRDEKKFIGPFSRYNHLKLVAKLPLKEEEEERVDGGDGQGAGTYMELQQKGARKEEIRVELKREGSFSGIISSITRRGKNLSGRPSNLNSSPSDEKKDMSRESVIAKYTCLAATKKCGRLAVYENALEEAACLNLGDKDRQVARDQLRHVVVATGLCMLQGEKQKRDTLKRIAETLLGEAGSFGGT